jgi:hypothetical protein
MAAADEAELCHMVHTMALHDSGPIAVRYPRGEGRGLPLPEVPQALEIGKGRIVREGKTVALLSLGTRLEEAEKAADELEARGLSTTVADLRFAKPLDGDLIRKLMTTHEVVVTVEEASIGGLGAHVLTLASDEGLVDAGLKIRTMRLPDRFLEHDKPEKQYDEARLNAPHIVETVLKALRINSAGVEEVRARALHRNDSWTKLLPRMSDRVPNLQYGCWVEQNSRRRKRLWIWLNHGNSAGIGRRKRVSSLRLTFFCALNRPRDRRLPCTSKTRWQTAASERGRPLRIERGQRISDNGGGTTTSASFLSHRCHFVIAFQVNAPSSMRSFRTRKSPSTYRYSPR